eukprot:2653088-Prymnesium_polylepis.1
MLPRKRYLRMGIGLQRSTEPRSRGGGESTEDRNECGCVWWSLSPKQGGIVGARAGLLGPKARS